MEILEGIKAGSFTSRSFETASISFLSEKFLLNFIFSMVSMSVLKKSSSLIFSSMSRNVETTFCKLVLGMSKYYHLEIVQLRVLSIDLIQFKNAAIAVINLEKSFELLEKL